LKQHTGRAQAHQTPQAEPATDAGWAGEMEKAVIKEWIQLSKTTCPAIKISGLQKKKA